MESTLDAGRHTNYHSHHSKKASSHKRVRAWGIVFGVLLVLLTAGLAWSHRKRLSPLLKRSMAPRAGGGWRAEVARVTRRFGPPEGHHEKVTPLFERASFDPEAAAHEVAADADDFGYDAGEGDWDAHAWQDDEDDDADGEHYDHGMFGHDGGHDGSYDYYNMTQRLTAVFPKIDTSGDGFVSADEMRAWHLQNNLKMMEHRVERVMSNNDQDGDGFLEFAEWFNDRDGAYDDEDGDEDGTDDEPWTNTHRSMMGGHDIEAHMELHEREQGLNSAAALTDGRAQGSAGGAHAAHVTHSGRGDSHAGAHAFAADFADAHSGHEVHAVSDVSLDAAEPGTQQPSVAALHDEQPPLLVGASGEELEAFPDRSYAWNHPIHREQQRAQFDAADEDHDGKLSVTELKFFLNPSLSLSEPLRIAALNATVSGHLGPAAQRIGRAEFVSDLWPIIMEDDRGYADRDDDAHEVQAESEQHAQSLFGHLDIDKDGILTIEELLPIFEQLQTSESYHAHASADDQVSSADSNGDGQLSLQEMLEHQDTFYNIDSHHSYYYEDYHDEF